MNESELRVSLRGKRISVTGGEGFLGRAIVERLRERGYADVCVVRRRDYDLIKGADVDRMFRDLRPNVVIHAAGVVGGIEANRVNPGRFFYENITMGVQLIEGARVHGVEKFVQIGTTSSYPKATPVPFREEHLWNGYPEETHAPFAIAKKALLVQCQAYRDQYGLNGIYLIPVNLYGPGDNFDPRTSHVFPALIRKFVEAKESRSAAVEIWGTGTATREFLYVDDAAEAVVLASECYNGREPVNVGSGMEISIRELSELIARETGYEGRIVWDTSKPEGQPRRVLEVTRAEEMFGFRARVNFIEGLRRTIAWYRASRSTV